MEIITIIFGALAGGSLAVAVLFAWRLSVLQRLAVADDWRVAELEGVAGERLVEVNALRGLLEASEQHPLAGRRVVINTRKPDDQSLRGFLPDDTLADAEWLVLQGCEIDTAEAPNSQWVAAPDRVATHRSAVSWMHVIPAEA